MSNKKDLWVVEYWDGNQWGLLQSDPWTNRSMTEKQATAEAADIRARGVEARAIPMPPEIAA